jgi:hypothetical protein
MRDEGGQGAEIKQTVRRANVFSCAATVQRPEGSQLAG